MGQGKLDFPAQATEKEKRHQVAEPQSCRPPGEIFIVCAGCELSLTRLLCLEETLVHRVVPCQQAEVAADNHPSWLGKGFHSVDRSRPRLLYFRGRYRDKGNGMACLDATGSQPLNLRSRPNRYRASEWRA
jgi:hypothetical protein